MHNFSIQFYIYRVSCEWKSCRQTCNCPNDGRSNGKSAQQYAIIANLKEKREKFISILIYSTN